ncbi:hypothetical protein JCM10908_007369 [Rhodotorula pacifica]|uniref:uncharacterized protein n=1 Tax=Rhodotorula pacifica TaxID=1495444 RepID=UPI00317C39B5
MTVLPFPARIPPGINPYTYVAHYVEAVFNPPPTPGFKARLIVLYCLTGYGIVLSLLYLTALLIDHRRRNKSIWLWKLVRRPNGRYLVGNAHFLFAITSLIVCGCLIGYIHNFWSVVIWRQDQNNSFFWRTLICLPVAAHLWFSSWSSLQAGLLASQAASIPHLLPPIVANTVYVGGMVALGIGGLTLDIIISIYWSSVWKLQRRLVIRCLLLATLRPTETVQDAKYILSGGFSRIDRALAEIVAMYRGIGALYVIASVVILAANIVGLFLLFALRRQIRFNSDRFNPEIPGMGDSQPIQPADHSSTPMETPQSFTPRDIGKPAVFELRQVPTHTQALSKKPTRDSMHGLAPPVHFIHIAQRVEQHSEHIDGGEEDSGDTTARDTVSNPIRREMTRPSGMPAPERLSPQEVQLLALRKVHADVVVFLVAIVTLACVALATGLWLAITPTSIYGSFAKLEAVYFVLVWMYLIGVDIALTFLLSNTLRHLPPSRCGEGTDHGAPKPLPPALFLPQAESDDERIRNRDRTPFDALQEEDQAPRGERPPIP